MEQDIIITNGVGTGELLNGSYHVIADVVGYDNTTLSPSSVTITGGEDIYRFLIAANGELTLHVTEEGTVDGTPIVGATFIRTDIVGNEYGDTITTDSDGNAVFSHVPYAEEGAPTIYFKQLSSDGEHDFDSSVQSVVMTEETETIEIQNSGASTRVISLTDAYYENLPIDSGTLTFIREEA